MFFTRKEIISAFKKDIFPYTDGFQVEKETDKEADEETDEKYTNAEIDTTDMPDLESEISAAERRNQQGQGLKILRPN